MKIINDCLLSFIYLIQISCSNQILPLIMRSLPIEMIRSIKEGDRKAFKIFYDTYASFVYSLSYRILKDNAMAEEVVQECFVNIWLKRETIDEKKEITSFIFVVAKRICLNYLRKIKYANIYLKQIKLNDVNDVEEKIALSDLQKSLSDRIALLPKQQRTAFELSRLEGYTHQQIAEQMGISPNTVKNHITQALAYLRKYLVSTNYEIPLIIFFFLFD